MVTLTLPDGKTLAFDAPPTGREVAERIGRKLAKAAVAVRVDGETLDLARPIEHDAAIAILTPADPEGLEVMRHSASHVMAEAILRLWPGTKLVYGPTIEDGFYYDVDCPSAIAEADLPRIEKEMQKIVKRNEPFVRRETDRDEAKSLCADNPYKLENIERADGDVILDQLQARLDR
ncbi:MAG: TGS domain-containing protein, partial [Planctomycetota bacterium]